MKLTNIIKLAAVAGLSFGAITPAIAQENTETLRKVYTEKEASVFGLKGILKLTISFQGQTQDQESPIFSNATCIGDGLFAVAYASINPTVSLGAMQRPGMEISTEMKELKLLNAAGEEFDAKVVLHDEDLGLAFVAIDPKGEKAKEFKGKAVDISKDVDLKHLDQVINISRLDSNLRYQSSVAKGYVSAIVQKPRKLYQIRGASISAPAFTAKGEFVGLTVAKTSKIKGQQAAPVTLPAKYIRNLVKQAQEKQAELKNAGETKKPAETKK